MADNKGRERKQRIGNVGEAYLEAVERKQREQQHKNAEAARRIKGATR